MKISKITLSCLVVSLAILAGCQKNNSGGAAAQKANKQKAPAAGSPYATMDVSKISDTDSLGFSIAEVGLPGNLPVGSVSYFSASISDVAPQNVPYQDTKVDHAAQYQIIGTG